MRDAARVLVPHMARSIEGEHHGGAFKDGNAEAAPEHKIVVARGSSTTIVSFSSAALLHAGQPTPEFQAFFDRYGADYNLVFFRDVHRSCYHLTPDGEPTGLAFYEADLRETLKTLGSTRHIAIGDSGGATAAIYFGTRCHFDKAIAFSSPFPMRYWLNSVAQIQAYFDMPLLIREPSAYWEHVLLASSIFFVFYLPITLRCGRGGIWDPIADYVAARQRPELTVFYGEGSRPERKIIAPLRDQPDVTIRPQPTAKHFCMVKLARSGQLGPTIMSIIDG